MHIDLVFIFNLDCVMGNIWRIYKPLWVGHSKSDPTFWWGGDHRTGPDRAGLGRPVYPHQPTGPNIHINMVQTWL